MELRLLIVRLSALGDVVHALPALELLRTTFPSARITWAVEPLAAPLVRGHPALDAVAVLDRPALGSTRRFLGGARQIWGAVRELRDARFDLALDLQGLLRSALCARASGARRVVGPAWAREGARLLYTDRVRVPRPAEAHAVTRYLALAHAAALVLGGRPPAPRIPRARLGPAVRRRAPRLAGRGPLRLCVLVGAGKEANRIPAPLLAEVCDRVCRARPGVSVVLLGNRGDRAAGARLAAATRLARPTDETGRTTIGDAASLLLDAACVLGGDTGLLHLARALGRPVVGVFPAADPRRTGPAGLAGDAKVEVLSGHAPCAPCCARRCRRPGRERICLAPLTAAAIAERVVAALPRPG